MNRRIWGIIIVVFSLVLIASIVYLIFFYKFSVPAEPVVTQPAAAEQPAAVPAKNTAASQSAPLKKTEVTADDLSRMAMAFAERFGSFSNQSDYGNLRDLQIFMTKAMKAWSQNYLNDARAKKTDASIYYGIITKAVASEVKKFDADSGQAEILVRTQRRESAGVPGNSSTFYQDLSVKYAREQGVWRVDGVYWQNR